MQDIPAGGSDTKTDQVLGICTLDSWFVAVKGRIRIDTAVATTKLAINSFGIETQPTTLPGRWNIAGTVNYNTLFDAYLAQTLDAFAAFGSTIKTPLFYYLNWGDLWTDEDELHFKKIFRKGIYSGDEITAYHTKFSLEGVADSVSKHEYKCQFKQVISPDKW